MPQGKLFEIAAAGCPSRRPINGVTALYKDSAQHLSTEGHNIYYFIRFEMCNSTHVAHTGISDVVWQPVEKRVADELSKEQTQ